MSPKIIRFHVKMYQYLYFVNVIRNFSHRFRDKNHNTFGNTFLIAGSGSACRSRIRIQVPNWFRSGSATLVGGVHFVLPTPVQFVGEYLMTLPQHLEPYMSGQTGHLARAFREAVFPGSKVGSSQQVWISPFLLQVSNVKTYRCYRYRVSRVIEIGF
jgi:hypothetical protein